MTAAGGYYLHMQLNWHVLQKLYMHIEYIVNIILDIYL